jgi:hypothetical protein
MSRIDKYTFLQGLVSQTAVAKAAQRASPKASSSHPTGMSPALSFEQRVAAGLAAIDPNAANSTKKGLEVYINAALLETFGPQLINDPAYAHLLSEVLEGMEQSPDYASFTRFVQAELKHVTR